ncbi:uncharacterized protein [Ptychodera flava]|uniref:uncharacterized protein n=1 Tax=Ptychodera flava TaxID=63121 RepID=UPI003969F90B
MEGRREGMTELSDEKDDLENRYRRNNVLFYGVEQAGHPESWEATEKKVKEIIKDTMQIEKDVQIERAHRIMNAPITKGSKPIIASFSSWKDKELILRNGRKLKGTNISVDEDFSPRMRSIRKKLFAKRRELLEQDKNIKTSVRYDKLIVFRGGRSSVYKPLSRVPATPSL